MNDSREDAGRGGSDADARPRSQPSEALFRQLVAEVRDYAIFMLDLDGRVMSWNAGAEQIKGYRAEEILGEHFSRFFPAEEVARNHPEELLAEARAAGRIESEGWRVRKDGTRFWANAVLTAVHDPAGGLAGFAKITRDLTERKRVEALEENRRQMSEFLAMLAHELRNPLAPIRNAVGILHASGELDPTLRWAHQVIDRQVDHMSRLVDDLLDVSRITRGKINLRLESVPLAEMVAAAVDAVRPQLEERRHDFAIEATDEPLVVRGDRTRLIQVLINLLQNAAKYTPDRGRIRLTLERQRNAAVLRVIDDGIGMSPALLERVFDLFTQGDQGLDRSHGGLGVGLTLVRRLIEMHGGTVRAASEGPGLGSELTVRLPLEKTSHAEIEPPEEPVAEAAVPAARRVLVVDDNRDAADSLSALVTLWGHETRIAYDGPSALAQAAAWRPDFVLLDIGLPDMSGYEVARQLRAAEALAPLTLVAITGYGQVEDRRRSREAGFDHHLVKPVEPAQLRELLAVPPASPPPPPDGATAPAPVS